MSLEFEEPLYAESTRRKSSSLTALVIRSGLAKDEKGADMVLIVFLVLLVAGVVGLWMSRPDTIIEPAPEPTLLP